MPADQMEFKIQLTSLLLPLNYFYALELGSLVSHWRTFIITWHLSTDHFFIALFQWSLNIFRNVLRASPPFYWKFHRCDWSLSPREAAEKWSTSSIPMRILVQPSTPCPSPWEGSLQLHSCVPRIGRSLQLRSILLSLSYTVHTVTLFPALQRLWACPDSLMSFSACSHLLNTLGRWGFSLSKVFFVSKCTSVWPVLLGNLSQSFGSLTLTRVVAWEVMFLYYVLEVRAQEQSVLANVDLHRNPCKDVKQPSYL